MKWIKIFLWLAGALVVLVVALVVALPFLFDPNDHKDEIAQLVQDKTGRNLDIQGDINLSVFPWLGVETGKVSFANPAQFGGEPMAKVDEASVRLRLLPLLSRQIEAGKVVIKGLELNLISDANGQTNWADLAASETTGENTVTDDATQAGVAALSLQGFDIRDSSIRYRDQAAGIEYQLSDLNMQTGVILPGKDVPLKISGTVAGTALEQPGTFDIDTSINMAAGGDLIRLTDVTLATTGIAVLNLKSPEVAIETKAQTVAIKEAALEGTYGDLTGTLNATSIAIDLQQETAKLSGFVLSSDDGRIEGDVTGNSITTQPVTSGNVKLSAVNVIGLLDKLKIDHGLGPEMSVRNVNASGSFRTSEDEVSAALTDVSMDAIYKALTGALTAPSLELDTGQQTFSAPELALDTEYGRIDASLSGSGIVDAPKFSGTLRTGQLELRKLLEKIGVEIDLEDETALSTATLQTRFDATVNSATLTELSAQVDDMAISGSLSVTDFEKPIYRFDLDVDRLDLDGSDGSPEGGSGESEGATQGSDQSAAAVLIPVALLRDLDADGHLSIGNLRAAGLKMSQVEVGMKSKGGQVTIDPIKSLLYEGKSLGTVRVDASTDVPTVAYRQDFSAVSLLPLLSDAEVSENLSGKGVLGIDFSTKGAAKNEITKNLNGTANLTVRDGAIKGFNLQKMLIKARQLYLKAKDREQEIDAGEEDETRFSEMTGSISVKDGIARNDDLAIKSPLFRISGEGSADLTRETIDYLMTVNVVESFQGQGGKELAELKGVPIPVRVDGTFADPKYRIDLAGLVKAKAKAKVDEKVEEEKEELEEKLKEKLEEKLGDKLKGLFN